MPNPDKINALLNIIPHLDQTGKFTGPSKAEAEKLTTDILALGKDGIVELVKMLTEVDDGTDYRPRYALHAMAQILVVPGQEKACDQFNAVLAGELGGNYPASVKGYLIRQLQVSGTGKNTNAIADFLSDEINFEDAANALLAIGSTAEHFRKALPTAKDKGRLTVIQALGVLKDDKAVDALRKAAGDEDQQVRQAAGWALARIGDAGAVDQLLKNADAKAFDRVEATDACLLLAENLIAAGKRNDAMKIYKHLQTTRTDPAEKHIKELAEAALGKTT